VKEMKNCDKFFNYSSLFSGFGCGTFCVLGFFNIIHFLPAFIGAVLFLIGIIALFSDKLYWQKRLEFKENYEPYIPTMKIDLDKNNLLKAVNITEVLNTFLNNLPLKSFSPGQTLIFLVSLILLLFILIIMVIQAIYDIHVFTQKDLRLGALIVGLILLFYTFFYALGELLGIKLLNSNKKNNQKKLKKNSHQFESKKT